MKNVLIISPHADDEILSSWTYLLLSRDNKISLRIIYQAIDEDDRVDIVKRMSDDFNFEFEILWPGWDAFMDKLPKNEVVDMYDAFVTDFYDEIIVPSKSFHQDHIIANESVFASLRRNLKSSILISEHPFHISYFMNNYVANRYIPFIEMEEKIKYLKMYIPYIKEDDIESMIQLNSFRGNQIGKKYAETFQVIREIK